MKKVTVYTTSYCPYCHRAKQLLQKKNISFQEVDLSEDDAKREELEAKTGCMTVPMIFIGENFIGGCDDLYALEKAGKLDQALQS